MSDPQLFSLNLLRTQNDTLPPGHLAHKSKVQEEGMETPARKASLQAGKGSPFISL